MVAVLFEKYTFTQGISSTVIDTDDEPIAYLKNKFQRFTFLDEHAALPIRVEYGTPKTLGKDCPVTAVGANCLQPGKNLLAIDAGTAITYEVIEAPGIFLGGDIPPGIITRLRASNHFTKKLFLVTEEGDIPPIGRSTETTIQAGVVNRIVYRMDGYIDKLKVKYPDFLVFLTGGYLFYLEKRLKNSILVDISLVLIGLSRILEYNVED